MRTSLKMLCVAVAIAGAFLFGRARAGEGEGCGGADDMAAWMKLAEKGPAHAEMAKMAGTWNAEVKSFHDPSGQPDVSQGKSVFTAVLDGRFMRQDFQGSMMGMQFVGIGYHGFDNATGEYVSTWMDSMGTGIMLSKGKPDASGKGASLAGSFFGPGGVEIKSRIVMKFESDDKHLMEMYMVMPGMPEMKAMEIIYTRAK
ncbi:MAG: DUF1579 domain-containing protein [Planctomycetaceae bacterium]